MNKLQGTVQTAEGMRGIPGLVIAAYLLQSNSEDRTLATSLGSVESDEKGHFTINFEFPDGVNSGNVFISVTGPELSDRGFPPPVETTPRENLLFVTSPRSVIGGSTESFSILIKNHDLSKASVVLPEAITPSSQFARETGSRLAEVGKSERELGKAISSRVTEQLILEEKFEADFLANFIDEITGKNIANNSQYPFVVGAEPERTPGVLSRKAIEDGVDAIQAERVASSESTLNPNRRRTRFFFTQEQLEQLNAATTDDGTTPPDGFKTIGDAKLKQILGMDKRISEQGMPTSVSREEALFNTFRTDTFEERCAQDFLAEDTGSQNGGEDPTPDQPPSDPESEESILRKLGRATEDIDAPLKTLTGRDGTGGVLQSIQEFAIPVGPADEPRVFDFSTLQIAFQDVWQSVLDSRIEPLARSLHTKTSKVLATEDGAFQPAELDSFNNIKRILQTVQNATTNASPGPAFFEVPTPDDPDPNAPIVTTGGHSGSSSSDNDGVTIDSGTSGGLITGVDPDDYLDANARPDELVKKLDEILREPYEFTAFGADNKSKAINFGLLVGYRHLMTPVAYQVGDLAQTVTLAPGESREYTSKTVITRKRSEKELTKHSSIRSNELDENTRAESEIVRKAVAKTSFSMTTDGTYNLGFTKGNASTDAGRDAESQSNNAKKDFREAVIKSAQEVRQERSIEMIFEETGTFEEAASGKIENTNNELTLTYMFFELQRRFRVNETIHKATPVILVAQEVPRPDEVTNAFLIEHSWVLKRALMDDSFQEPLDYLCNSIVGDRLEVRALRDTYQSHQNQVADLRTQLVSLERQAGRRYEALLQAVRERLGQERAEEGDGFLSDAGDFLFGGGPTPQAARLAEEAARDAERRAAEKAKEMATFLQRAVDALNDATEKYGRALRNYNNKLLQIAKLRVHVKQNILHYMQAIWSHEVDDQRFLRLYQLPVPQFTTRSDQEPLYRRLGETSDVTHIFVDAFDPETDEPIKKVEVRFGVDFELLPSIDTLPTNFDRPLVEVAELNNLLGFMGNYMIFPMKESNALTELMLNPYIDEGLRLLDPHDPGNVTRPEFAEYICRLREELGDEEFNKIRPQLKARYREMLESSEYAGDEIVVPSGSLYVEALPGSKPLLERFKLAHRAFDMVAAQEDSRKQAIENLRLAARLVGGELSDPDIDAQYNFSGGGDDRVVAPAPSPGSE